MSSPGFIPAAPPPPGVTSNFDNPAWIGYRLITVSVVFPVFALFFLVPRLYSAGAIIRKWHPDDFLICVGFAFGLANAMICLAQSTMGMGNHIYELEVERFKAVMKLGMIGGAMTYNLATLFIKLSILSFYLRFSVDRWFRITVYVVMFITVGYTIPNAFLFSYICIPYQRYWDWSIQGTCINDQAAFDSANILNMVTDYMILVLPIWMLRPLRVPLLKKIGVALILMAGGFVCGISTMRMITARMGAGNDDVTWHYPVNLIWCIVEVFVGIVCACLPCLKAFSKRFFPNLFLFSPSFQRRVSSSFPFSSFRLDTVSAIANGNTSSTNNNDDDNVGNGNGSDEGNDVGGRRAWWRLRRGGEGTQGGVTRAGSDGGEEEVKSQGGSTGKASVDGKPGGSDEDLEVGKAGDQRLAGATDGKKES